MERIIKNVMTVREAKGLKLNYDYAKTFHEQDGAGSIIEWEIPNYNKNLEFGSYTLVPDNFGLKRVKNCILRDNNFDKLESASLVSKINIFFSKEKQLRDLGLSLIKRGFLLHGPAGAGKSHQINNTVLQTLGDKGISFSISMSDTDISQFVSYLRHNDPPEGCNRLFIIIEDLGGGEQPDLGHRVMASGDHLLAFLDGNSIPENWKNVPIVIFSTTNYPKLFLANLVDRPGRFDEVISVDYPSGELMVEYAESFLGSSLTDFDKREILKGGMSIAHIKDSLIRKVVYEEDIRQTLVNMRKWSDTIQKSMEKKEL